MSIKFVELIHQTRQKHRRVWCFLLIGYGIAVASLLFYRFQHWAYDDPFITYRYAQNLFRGVGFVYNPSERILSTTTPLFTLLLAIFQIITPEVPGIARWIGVISVVAGAFLLWDLGIGWKDPVVGLTGLFLYPLFSMLLTTIGSETPFFIALCLGAFAAYARGKYSLTGLLVGVATLARPDAILIAPIMAAHYLINVRHPLPWKGIILLFIPLVLWGIFSWSYFGSPIPVTLAAKQHQGEMAISQKFIIGLFNLAKGYLRIWPFWVITFLGLAGIIFAFFKRSKWLIILIWTGTYILSYTLLGVSRYFWYYAPVVPGLVVALGSGFSAFIHLGVRLQSKKIIRLPVFLQWISTLLFVFCYITLGANAWETGNTNDTRFRIYQSIGKWLHDTVKKTDTVGMLEVGIIGYYSERTVIDFAGLIQPEVAKQMGVSTNYEVTAQWAINRYHPTYIIVSEGWFPNLERDYLQKSCRPSVKFNGSDYQYQSNIVIYKCFP